MEFHFAILEAEILRSNDKVVLRSRVKEHNLHSFIVFRLLSVFMEDGRDQITAMQGRFACS